jgi:transposase-like protein
MNDAPECPMCGSTNTCAQERLRDNVARFVCMACGATWADRTEP